MGRHPSYARRQLRRTAREFLVDNRGPLLILLASYPVGMALSRLLGDTPSYVRGFLEGGLLVLVLSAAVFLFLLHTEGLQQLAGAQGEDLMEGQLEKARKRGHVWGAVRNVEVGGSDVDSIVVTPGGVLALEAKWKFRRLDRRWLPADLEKAERGARKARSILRSQPIGEVHDVTPVLVLWGKGRSDIKPEGEQHGDVTVVDGAYLVDWLAAWREGGIARDEASRTLEGLETFAETHRATSVR